MVIIPLVIIVTFVHGMATAAILVHSLPQTTQFYAMTSRANVSHPCVLLPQAQQDQRWLVAVGMRLSGQNSVVIRQFCGVWHGTYVWEVVELWWNGFPARLHRVCLITPSLQTFVVREEGEGGTGNEATEASGLWWDGTFSACLPTVSTKPVAAKCSLY